MTPEEEKLLEQFEEFELDLEVEEILKKVKEECVLDRGLREFPDQLEERNQHKGAAQAAREALVKQKWTPGHYPKLTCHWFVKDLDFCCDYWRYQFKRPRTPPPAPLPSPDASRKTALPTQQLPPTPQRHTKKATTTMTRPMTPTTRRRTTTTPTTTKTMTPTTRTTTTTTLMTTTLTTTTTNSLDSGQ